jgi:fumarate reductase subunit D
MFKNVTDWKSTIQGILVLIVSVLVGFGIITPEDSEVLNSLLAQVLAGAVGVVGGIVGIYRIFFVKDSPVEPVE